MSSAGAEELLKSFKYERVLNEDLTRHSINLLGTTEEFEGKVVPAIILLTKTPLTGNTSASELVQSINKVESLGSNDVYKWLMGWVTNKGTNADYKVTIIAPATETHIRKYSRQGMKMIKETSEVYESVVKTYIDQIPHSRLTWLRNILSHVTETEKIIYEALSPNQGFMIIPDLKWDQQSLSSLYVLAIVQDPTIRSLRDITPVHLPLLKAIAADGTRAVQARYGVPRVELRLFVHYQPSYYQFHVHIVHIEHTGFPGIATGQAHLLDDIIENLKQEMAQKPLPEKSFYARRTFTYALGENHEMFEKLWEATKAYHSDPSDLS